MYASLFNNINEHHNKITVSIRILTRYRGCCYKAKIKALVLWFYSKLMKPYLFTYMFVGHSINTNHVVQIRRMLLTTLWGLWCGSTKGLSKQQVLGQAGWPSHDPAGLQRLLLLGGQAQSVRQPTVIVSVRVGDWLVIVGDQSYNCSTKMNSINKTTWLPEAQNRRNWI